MHDRQQGGDGFFDCDPQQRQNFGYGRYHEAGYGHQQRFGSYRRQRNGFMNVGDMTLADNVTSSWSAADGPTRQRYNFTPAQSQNYITDTTVPWGYDGGFAQHQQRNTSFEFPTRFGGRFAQAMSSIANDPEGGISGRHFGNNLDSNFQNEVSQALAIKLDLKTKQHANSKALQKLIKAKGVCPTLKQAIQARAAVYGEVGEPTWFVRSTDISAKASTSVLRRSVRVQLAAAPLTVAQVGLQRLCTLLNSGDSSVLHRLSLGDHYTVAEILKMLSQAPPIAVLKLLDKAKSGDIASQARIVEADLDFVQSVLDLVAVNDSLNPSMNSVAEAFKRRLLYGRFASGEHSIKLDALVFAQTRESVILTVARPISQTGYYGN